MLEQTSRYLTPRPGQSRSTTPDTRQRSPSVDRGLAVDEGSPVDVDDDLAVDEESPVDVDEPDGSAYAMPGVVAMATPTPRVTANAPTRPMCLA